MNIMQHKDFFTIANYIKDNSPENCKEAADRTAVSRIYYAAFLYAREALKIWGCCIDKSSKTHSQVAEGLKYSTLRPLVKVGEYLERLHDARKKADYDIHTYFQPDFEKLEKMYENIISLENKWDYVNDKKKKEALGKINKRISEI